MTKIGIISFAHMHAYDYANAIKEISNAELVSIYDDNVTRGNEAALQYEADYYKDLDLFLQSDIDAVIVTSENSLHKEHVIKSAQAKKDILCEKPIATNLKDATLMVEVCKEEDVKLQIAYPVRFCDAIKEGKERVEELGDLLFIKTTNRGRNPGGWFIDKPMSGGGAVLDHTVHMVDVVRWYTGLEITEVSAQIDTMFSKEDIDDAGIIDFKLENGLLMTHDCSWSKNKKYPTWGDVTIEMYGTKGSLEIDAFKDHFVSYDDAGMPIAEYFSGNDMNLELVQDFVDAVEEKHDVKITGYDGIKSLEASLGAYTSAKENKTIKL